MGMENLGDLLAEIKQTSANIDRYEGKQAASLERVKSELRAEQDGLRRSIDELYLKTSRPGSESTGSDLTHKDAIGLCYIKHALAHPKDDGAAAIYTPSHAEIDEAGLVVKAWRGYLRHGNVERLDPLERKSLSSFSFGGAAGSFLLPPTMSDRVLSCLVEPSDISGLVDNISISTGSIQYLIDNAMLSAQWTCDSACFPSQTNPEITGLGTLEIKAEPLSSRFARQKNFWKTPRSTLNRG